MSEKILSKSANSCDNQRSAERVDRTPAPLTTPLLKGAGGMADSQRTPKLCSRCRDEKSEFPANAKARDGRSSWCSDCHRDYMRGRPSDPDRRREAAKASSRRHPDKRRAREAVKDAVRRGDLPPVRTLACFDCGDPARAYDHQAGYDKPIDVQPVCFECHGKRSRGRGEHKKVGKKAAGRLLDGQEWNEMPEVRHAL